MWIKKKHGTPPPRREKLVWEIIGLMFVICAISIFSFFFLYYTSSSIMNERLLSQGYSISDLQYSVFYIWLRSICFVASTIVFFALFLFFLGQKFSYVLSIIQGVQILRDNQLDFVIPVEGNDELTELAENINYLSASVREHLAAENRLKKEKEELVRSLSHDIRTPLTSIISYSAYLKDSARIEDQVSLDYIQIIQDKAEQIKELSGQMLSRDQAELILDGRLLVEQLIEEWEESLEETFELNMIRQQFGEFSGEFRVQDLRRIFDNLSSNIIKYANPRTAVELELISSGSELTLIQRNAIQTIPKQEIESHGIGLNSIRQITQSYGGETHLLTCHDTFEIKITLPINTSL